MIWSDQGGDAMNPGVEHEYKARIAQLEAERDVALDCVRQFANRGNWIIERREVDINRHITEWIWDGVDDPIAAAARVLGEKNDN